MPVKEEVDLDSFRLEIVLKSFINYRNPVEYNKRVLLAAYEETKQQIKRHVDDVAYLDIKYDNMRKCEFCGEPWTEKSDVFNGGCCNKDWEEEDKRTEQARS